MCDIYFRLLGYENLEVVNPEGGKDDAEEEAYRGRWKQEVCVSIFLWFSARSAIFPEFDIFILIVMFNPYAQKVSDLEFSRKLYN